MDSIARRLFPVERPPPQDAPPGPVTRILPRPDPAPRVRFGHPSPPPMMMEPQFTLDELEALISGYKAPMPEGGYWSEPYYPEYPPYKESMPWEGGKPEEMPFAGRDPAKRAWESPL